MRAEAVYVLDAPQVDTDDVDRESVRAAADPATGEPVIVVRLTKTGRENFEELTRAVAHRGADRGAPQHLLIVIDDSVYASPSIDYERNPDGIPAESGVQISGLGSLTEARELAKALRGD